MAILTVAAIALSLRLALCASVVYVWYMIQIVRGDMERTQRQLHAKYGPLLRIAPNEIACADPEAIKLIYRNQGALDKTEFYPNFSKHKDAFTETKDKVHGERRRIVNHVYTLANVLKSEEYIDRCSDLMLLRLKERAETDEPIIDLGHYLQMYAFDVIGELYLGEMFGFLQNNHDHGGWIRSLDLLMPFLCLCAVAPVSARPFILASSLFVPGSFKALKAVEHIGISARSYVARRFDEGTRLESRKRSDMLQQLFEVHLEKGDKVDFHMGDIEQEAYVALFAGSDTTAIGFRSLFYHLIKNPDVYEKLQSEIDRGFSSGRLKSPVKFSEAIKLEFLSACIKEALRVHPGVQLTMGRVVPAEGLELSGMFIPGGFWVGMNPAVVHFDKSIFGEDADEFRPARWLEPDAAVMDRHMLTFGYGTRTCIGKNISLAELHKLTPELLRYFELELADKNSVWKTRNLWFCKQENVIVRLRKRNI
ncbi:pisatin demethylase [Diaporthe amygdali]|uniref:pisatin demethylase n=1 Tax=Phomopsis amygdali TaxID=1214568 RepID=UPI0022FE3CBC|nr:pisatin demethylase [Diaporthe amygdali]KAJ0107927.1 pisatin demethylase [Diaporthe amygdali]